MSTLPPQQPRVTGTAGASVDAKRRRNAWLIPALLVLIVVLVARSCATYENHNEKLMRAFTSAVQNDDLAEVQKLENSGTAADMSRGRLGQAADVLAPLGAVQKVKEVTPKDDPPRVHEFDVTLAKGTVHEKVELDPQGKIFHFHYDQPQPKS
jgi:hypothetical protein